MPINLLPEEFKPKTSFKKLSKSLWGIFFVMSVFLVFGLLVFFGLTYMINGKVEQSNQVNLALAQQVETLEQTETRLVLVKDRLEKIKTVTSVYGVTNELDNVSSLNESLPPEVEIQAVNLDFNTTNLTVNTASSTGISNFIKLITNLESYRQVEMQSFNFNPEQGYSISFSMSR